MKQELEALFFATDSPLTLARLKAIFPGTSSRELREAIGELATDLENQGHAFSIVEFGGGWQVATRPEYAPLIEKLFRGRRVARLSRAGLEVLAIIAYRQPVTRMDIEDIRGVQCSGVLSTLTERNLITVVGRSSAIGHPLLYGTTREFLNHVGLRGLGQLPKLTDVEGMLDRKDELKAFASQIGQEVSEEDLQQWQSVPADGSGEESTFSDEGNPSEPPGPADEPDPE